RDVGKEPLLIHCYAGISEHRNRLAHRLRLAYPVGCQNGRLQDGILHKQRQTARKTAVWQPTG
ncbi:MAG: hypothetical protein WCQ21_32770, partial [Verrucomicrobiota bacterium]